MAMRILFLTNFYPPFELGGQGQSCEQVVEGLKQRGHTTLVLTSRHGISPATVATEGIARSLYLEMDLTPWRHSLAFFTERKRRDRHNLQCLEHIITQFEPDIVFIWGMWNLPRSLPTLAETQCPHKVIYRFAEYWPTLPSQHEFYWRTPGRRWYSRPPKWVVGRVALALLARAGRPPALQFEHAICVSAATRDVLVEQGIPVAHARIIHTGLDERRYLGAKPPEPAAGQRQNLKLLFAGRLAASKGLDTALEALSELVIGRGLKTITLTIAGSGQPEYEKQLRQLIAQAGVGEQVTLLGRVPSSEMPQLMPGFDVLLVPSAWPEPFARVILEGMISGLAVVASSAGGTPEIVRDGENGLLFAPGNAADLAEKIAGLAADPHLRAGLARAGRATVRTQFTLTKMIAQVEDALQEVAAASDLNGSRPRLRLVA